MFRQRKERNMSLLWIKIKPFSGVSDPQSFACRFRDAFFFRKNFLMNKLGIHFQVVSSLQLTCDLPGVVTVQKDKEFILMCLSEIHETPWLQCLLYCVVTWIVHVFHSGRLHQTFYIPPCQTCVYCCGLVLSSWCWAPHSSRSVWSLTFTSTAAATGTCPSSPRQPSLASLTTPSATPLNQRLSSQRSVTVTGQDTCVGRLQG